MRTDRTAWDSLLRAGLALVVILPLVTVICVIVGMVVALFSDLTIAAGVLKGLRGGVILGGGVVVLCLLEAAYRALVGKAK